MSISPGQQSPGRGGRPRPCRERIASGDAPIPLDAERIIVHGFYRFTVAQRRLLRALAERGMDNGPPEAALTITLPWDERRPLLFAAPGRTLARLRSDFDTREILLTHDARGEGMRARSLHHLSAFLFAGAGPGAELPGGAPEPTRRSGSSRLPTLRRAEMVAREFRRLHERHHIPWSEFGVILRSAADYAPILSSIFERYEYRSPQRAGVLRAEPLLATVLTLLNVVGHAWRKEDVLAFLKSSYTAPDCLEVDRLRKQAAASAIRAGARSGWHSRHPDG